MIPMSVWTVFRRQSLGDGHLKCSEGLWVPTGKTIWYKGFIFVGVEIIFFFLCVGVLLKVVKCSGLRLY